MPHFPPSDFEIDTNERAVTHKASGRKYSWDRSSEMGDATHYHHRSKGHTDISLHDSHLLIRYAFKALREAEYAAGRSQLSEDGLSYLAPNIRTVPLRVITCTERGSSTSPSGSCAGDS
jgi:hypothetical protein